MTLYIIISVFIFIAIIPMLIFLFDVRKRLIQVENAKQNELDSLRGEISKSEQEIKNEVKSNQTAITNTLTQQIQSTTTTLVKTLETLGNSQTQALKNVTDSTRTLTQSNETRIEKVRETVDQKLKDLQTSNEQKLEQINTAVNEKLQTTLTERLQEAFNQVSERLESVHKGLGKMQNLAEDVGNLQSVLTDVRARGAWGEVMLGTILDEILTPDQYGKQVKIHAREQRVDFAIRLPGNSDALDTPVWLPIDSKFPTSAYQELAEATNRLDKDIEQAAIKKLMKTVKDNAKSIQEKYIVPPHTTEFAIMFLPTEGLYAEVIRQPGKVEQLLQEHRVVVAGPTTLASILLSIRVGFQTLAIQKHSTELWDILATVKNGFRDFDEAIRLLKTHLNRASNTVERVDKERQLMDKALSNVEQRSPDKTSQIQSPTDNELSANDNPK